MYGTDTSQTTALAATGSAVLGSAGWVLASGVMILAGVTLVSIALMLHYRATRKDNQ